MDAEREERDGGEIRTGQDPGTAGRARRRTRGPGPGDLRRGVLLGRRGVLPRRPRGGRRRLGLHRRGAAPADLRAGVLGGDRARRGRARHLRPRQGVLRAPARGVLASPRPHHAQPAGPRRRHAVPLGGLRPRRRAGAPRQGVARAVPGSGSADRSSPRSRRRRRSGRPRRTTSATWSAPGTGRATWPTGRAVGAAPAGPARASRTGARRAVGTLRRCPASTSRRRSTT